MGEEENILGQDQTGSQAGSNAESFYMTEGQIASRSYRVYASMWDGLYSAIFVLPTILICKYSHVPSYIQGLCTFAVLSTWNILFVYYTQATPGKSRYGLKVLTVEKDRLHILQIITRELFSKFFSRILGLGYLLCFFRKDHRTLHDLMSGTNVYRSTITQPKTRSAGDYLVRFTCLALLATILLTSMMYVKSIYPGPLSWRSPLIAVLAEIVLG